MKKGKFFKHTKFGDFAKLADEQPQLKLKMISKSPVIASLNVSQIGVKTPQLKQAFKANQIAAGNGSMFQTNQRKSAQIKISGKLAYKEELCTRNFL